MIISHSKKFICLNPPKTGSGWREAIFAPHSDFDVIKAKSGKIPEPKGIYRHFNYCLAKEFLEKHDLNICDYFVFTFVRNPWERAVSWANMKLQTENTKIERQLLLRAVNAVIHKNFKQSAYYNIPANPLKKIDYIGSLERHEADIRKIGAMLKLNLNQEVCTFRHNSFHKEISKFWDEELIELIKKEESETIDLMDYKFSSL